MKKLTIISLSLLLLLALSACTNKLSNESNDNNTNKEKKESSTLIDDSQNDSNSYISRESAIEIALKNMGASQKEVFELEADFDRELNKSIWEVDFEHDGHEYSYYIDAVSGEILRIKKEAWD